MSNKSAVIKVHYYFVSVSDSKESEWTYKTDVNQKLNSLLEELKNDGITDRKWEPNGTVDNSVVLLNINRESNNFWKLNFIKVRDEAMPGKINLDGVFTDIPLEENEYIGEDMTMLYYPQKNVIAVQRNFYSVSASKIEDYFNHMSIKKNNGLSFKFEPIIDSGQKNIDNSIIRSVRVSCLDLSGDGISAAIRNTDTFGAGRVVIEYGVGTRKKDASLKQEALNWIISLLGDDRFTKLEVDYKADKDSPVCKIDFLDNKIEDRISIIYSKQQLITHEGLYLNILPKFKELINNKL